MIPLVAFSEELKHLRWMCEDDIKAVEEEYGIKLEIPIGTMIELPRAAITADHIAKIRRLLQLWHQRPHADLPRLLP